MKLEDQVCTFKQAEKLSELGFCLDTQFIYFGGVLTSSRDAVQYYTTSTLTVLGPKKYYAPNTAELGVLLHSIGFHVSLADTRNSHPASKNYMDSTFWYELVKISNFETMDWDNLFKTEAKARADALIWLIENGHVKPEDLKL